MPIKHKGSDTAGYQWKTTDLVLRQLGVNTADGTLHMKKENGDIQTIGDANTYLGAFNTVVDLEARSSDITKIKHLDTASLTVGSGVKSSGLYEFRKKEVGVFSVTGTDPTWFAPAILKSVQIPDVCTIEWTTSQATEYLFLILRDTNATSWNSLTDGDSYSLASTIAGDLMSYYNGAWTTAVGYPVGTKIKLVRTADGVVKYYGNDVLISTSSANPTRKYLSLWSSGTTTEVLASPILLNGVAITGADFTNLLHWTYSPQPIYDGWYPIVSGDYGFAQLNDTFSYTGNEGKIVKVKADGTGLEPSSLAIGLEDLSIFNLTDIANTDLVKWNTGTQQFTPQSVAYVPQLGDTLDVTPISEWVYYNGGGFVPTTLASFNWTGVAPATANTRRMYSRTPVPVIAARDVKFDFDLSIADSSNMNQSDSYLGAPLATGVRITLLFEQTATWAVSNGSTLAAGQRAVSIVTSAGNIAPTLLMEDNTTGTLTFTKYLPASWTTLNVSPNVTYTTKRAYALRIEYDDVALTNKVTWYEDEVPLYNIVITGSKVIPVGELPFSHVHPYISNHIRYGTTNTIDILPKTITKLTAPPKQGLLKFDQLNDTFQYAGNATKLVRVKADESGLEPYVLPDPIIQKSITGVTALTELDSVLVDGISVQKWIVNIEEPTGANRRVIEVLATHDGYDINDATVVNWTEYAKIDVGTIPVDLDITVTLSGSGTTQTMVLNVQSPTTAVNATARRV